MKEKNLSYQLTWLTSQLAVGYAPMSYDELDSIRDQGIVAIVNLCGELSDLHEIEEQSGFEVCFLPTLDECAPDMEKRKEALGQLDAREASIEPPNTIDLLPFFHDYEALLAETGTAEQYTAVCLRPFCAAVFPDYAG